MITVHHLENSRSHRTLWLLEELEVEYQLVEHKRVKGRAPKALEAIHPLGKSPVIVLDDGATLAESGAITEELVESHGPHLRPSDTESLRRYRYFMHFAEGSMMAPLLVKLIFNKLRRAPLPFFIKPVARKIADKVDGQYTDRELRKIFGFVESELADRDYFAGEFSAADIQMSYGLEAGATRAATESMPNIAAFVARMKKRPAYQRAVERGGGLDFGKM